jgi:hypothetical protein
MLFQLFKAGITLFNLTFFSNLQETARAQRKKLEQMSVMKKKSKKFKIAEGGKRYFLSA